MNIYALKSNLLKTGLLIFNLSVCISGSNAQQSTLNLDLGKANVNVSPRLYGLMTEEINHAYDGGLYGELIRNRIFKDNKIRLKDGVLCRIIHRQKRV